MNALRYQARKQPFALAVALVILGIALVSSPIAGARMALRTLFGTGYEPVLEAGHWWSPLTSVFLTDNSAELLLVLAGAIVILGFAERLMGTWRTAAAFFLGAVAGTGLGIVAERAGVLSGELWSRGVRELWVLDPFTPITACIMAASCFAGPLWRRRIRVLTLASVLVLLLYSGQPSDLYRLVAALIGLGIGAAFRPRRIDLSWHRSSDHEARTLLAAVVAVLAVGPVVTVFSGGRFGLLAPLALLLAQGGPVGSGAGGSTGGAAGRCMVSHITRGCVQELTVERISGVGPVLVSLLPLVALAVAAFGLARGRRFGAWLAIVLNAGLAVLGALYFGILPSNGEPFTWHWRSPHYGEVALALIVSVLVPFAAAIAVAVNLRRFPVRSRPGRALAFVTTSVGSFVLLAVAYVGLGWLLRSQFRPVVTLVDLLTDVPERFIPVAFLRWERLSFVPTTPVSATVYEWVGPIFWLIVIGGAVLCMRSGASRVSESDRARLRALLAQGGGGSLGFMSTWRGNSLWFNRDSTAAVAYRVINGVAITTGEPICSVVVLPQQGREALEGFARMCDDHGWVPVFYGLHERWRPAWEAMGWQSMSVGEETLIRPQGWSTRGKKWQDIRSSVNRAERAGVRAVWTGYRSLPLLQSLQITEISEQWVQEKGLPELGFTLGGLEELRDPAVRLMIALDENDHLWAVTSWLPSYREGTIVGWTLDFMRRRPESMNGVMEFLIARTASMLSEQPEVEFLSLSAAPLARVDGVADERAGRLAAGILDFLGRVLEPVYGFQSLLAFKRKFQPEYHRLFMAYPDPVALPAIGLALARAYLPTLSLREAAAVARSLG